MIFLLEIFNTSIYNIGGYKVNNTCSIILAAGEGKRMKSNSPKVLSEVLFDPMIKWVINATERSGINDICIVAGYQKEKLENYINNLGKNYSMAVQSERKGTGHAVMMAEDFLRKHEDSDVLILNGDAPFIDSQTIKNAFDLHKSSGSSATVISAKISDPQGYGRIIRNKLSGELDAIIEHKDANESQLKVNEVNSGAYWFKVKDLLSVLFQIKNQNSQGEYYLPDTISLMINKKLKVQAFLTENSKTILGANDCLQLSQLNEMAREAILKSLMLNGVNIPFKDGVMIGPDAEIKGGTTILPGTIIKGRTRIGASCKVGPNSVIINCIVGDNVILNAVQCENSNFNDGEIHGPFKMIKNKS